MLTLPFLLMVHNAPLVFLPIIAVHLLFFSFITVLRSQHKARFSGGPTELLSNLVFGT